MNDPLVSIVIPVYNGSNYIREALESALEQSYSNCEIIVVNDGSTDNTEEILLSYGNNIRYFYKENGGVSTALNLGIEKMRSEYFSWLSHDDIYYHDKIERQINALKNCGDMTRIVWGDYDWIVKENDGQMRLYPRQFLKTDTTNVLTDSVYPVIKHYIAGCALLIHRSHFERVGLFRTDLRYTQDYDLWFRMFCGQKTVCIASSLYKSRLHPQQVTNTASEKMHSDEAVLWYGITNSIEREEVEKWFRSMYEFYRYMYLKVVNYGNDEITQSIFDMFAAEKVPSANNGLIDYLKEYISTKTLGKTCRLCILGTDTNDIHAYHELLTYNIKVDFFVDTDNAICNDKKAATSYVKCLSFDELSEIKDTTLVIIQNRRTNTKMKQLNDANFPYVISMEDLKLKIMYYQRKNGMIRTE